MRFYIYFIQILYIDYIDYIDYISKEYLLIERNMIELYQSFNKYFYFIHYVHSQLSLKYIYL